MMKKIFSILIIFIILILMSNSVFASEYWEKENKKRENAFREALNSYMQTFMTEETPEEDKITSYEYTGFGVGEVDNENKLAVTISFNVTPANENNTTWFKHGNCCFAVFSKINEENVLEKISRYPDNYDKFLEKFEEYKKNNKETTENIQIQGQQAENNLANQEIEKISNTIYISCSIVLITIICLITVKFLKNRKKHV